MWSIGSYQGDYMPYSNSFWACLFQGRSSGDSIAFPKLISSHIIIPDSWKQNSDKVKIESFWKLTNEINREISKRFRSMHWLRIQSSSWCLVTTLELEKPSSRHWDISSLHQMKRTSNIFIWWMNELYGLFSKILWIGESIQPTKLHWKVMHPNLDGEASPCLLSKSP
jgi:hypothetical protein